MTPTSGDEIFPQAPQPADADLRPKVSVLLQTYNHERFIAQAIQSVLDQDRPFPIEVIVSDDCSSDGTRALVSDYARAHRLIKPLFPDQHLGMNPLFRRALDAARGDYLAVLDGDDFWTSTDKLRKQVALLESEPKLTGCFHDALVVFEDGTRPAHRYVSAPNNKERFELEDLLRLCYPPTLSVLFRREMLAHVPGWAFDLAWADWLLWIFATRQGPFAYINEIMGVYRVHEGGYFSSQDRSTQLQEDLRLYRRVLDEFPDQRDLIERCIIQRSCELGAEESASPLRRPGGARPQRRAAVGGKMPCSSSRRTTEAASRPRGRARPRGESEEMPRRASRARRAARGGHGEGRAAAVACAGRPRESRAGRCDTS